LRQKWATIVSVIGDRSVAGVKLDVEGFAIEALRGGRRVLSKHPFRLIQLEWDRTSLKAARQGYGLFRLDLRSTHADCAIPAPARTVPRGLFVILRKTVIS